jgi:hypothetical protein
MTIQELVEELDQMEPILNQKIDVSIGEQIATQGEELRSLLPRCYSIASELERQISILKEDFLTSNNLLMSKVPSVDMKEIMVEAHLADIICQFKRANGFVKSIENSLNMFRTNLSYLKTDLNNLR